MSGWLSWIVALVGAVVIAAILARRSFRAGVRRELLEVLRAEVPGIEITEEGPAHLRLRLPGGGQGLAHLDRLYADVARLGRDAPLEDRREVYRHWAATVRESSQAGERLSFESHGERVLPRLVSPAFFSELPPDAAIPHTPLGETGLAVAYVLDHEHSVAYLTLEHLEELGLDRAGAHELALENLFARTERDRLRQAVVSDGVAVIRTGDSYDAARLLLVPTLLPPGESRVAAVPDRDTLVLMPARVDLDDARKVAHTAGDRPLFDRPLRVSREGFALV